ncbi:MAG: 50S ribosomal protein L18 [Candidatus Eremiobacteraeota bacterium]|nr:50S ribosomal protein L18 [Candidatus Eremiobacteraeota bacterium]
MPLSRADSRRKRHVRLRRRVAGTAATPRLQVQRTLHHIYAILVDDEKGHTLASSSTREKSLSSDLKSKTSLEAAKRIGAEIAAKAKGKGITSVVFDTGGRKYHGRVAALAQAARDAGLEF